MELGRAYAKKRQGIRQRSFQKCMQKIVRQAGCTKESSNELRKRTQQVPRNYGKLMKQK